MRKVGLFAFRFNFSNFSWVSLDLASLKIDLFLSVLGLVVNIIDYFGVILVGEVRTVVIPGQLVMILKGYLVKLLVFMTNLLQTPLLHYGDRVRLKLCNRSW